MNRWLTEEEKGGWRRREEQIHHSCKCISSPEEAKQTGRVSGVKGQQDEVGQEEQEHWWSGCSARLAEKRVNGRCWRTRAATGSGVVLGGSGTWTRAKPNLRCGWRPRPEEKRTQSLHYPELIWTLTNSRRSRQVFWTSTICYEQKSKIKEQMPTARQEDTINSPGDCWCILDLFIIRAADNTPARRMAASAS
ncbi:hypothetical protein D4764_14G0011840 [Takifugu flavidus]|uniref:Uncharacterized protein n=1 Tax=Takifugu flavidus TaxID=433684 RepID=A0A5C6P8J8_9TELE|nr:hypothetical protein D4764_14G0011840 [Takifugu flavidus]